MLAPAVVYAVLFSYIPMAGIVLAFKNFNYSEGIFGSPWAGLSNFRFLLISGKLWPLTRNTLLYNMAFIATGMACEVGFAVSLSEIGGRLFRRLFQSFCFLPFFISWVVVASFVQGFIAGEFGLPAFLRGGGGFDPYAHASLWPFLLVALKLWKNTGYGAVIYLAGIAAIDPVLYEAASIDGANAWQRIRHVTLAGLGPLMAVMFLLALGRVFRGDFGLFYQLVGNNGSLLDVADVLDLFVYRALSTTGDVGMAGAAGLYQSLLCFIAVTAVNIFMKRVRPEYSLF